VREDRGDGAGAGFAGRLGCPDFKVEMFDKELVDALVRGEDSDCGLGELNVKRGLTRRHGSVVINATPRESRTDQLVLFRHG
jgi:hypothetical protein